MAGDGYRVNADALTGFTAEMFRHSGVPQADAGIVAEVLVWANLRGMDSHGVLRIPRYLQRLENGSTNPEPDFKAVTETPATLVLDADLAYGPVAMTEAMRRAIPKARETGIGWVVVRNTTHMGAIGHYTLQAVAADMAGLVIGSSVPNMAYYGARDAGVATSPIAIAVPGGDHPPVMLDMATSAISMGSMTFARDSGRDLPEGVALDGDGNPTTDSARAVMPLPMGGPKGSGLALMFECLTGLMVANPLVETKITGSNTSHRQNGLCVAIDIGAFTDVAGYKANIDAMVAALKTLPRAKGVDEILAPGERGDAIALERRRDGIPLPAGTWERLAETARRLGVEMPETV